MKHFIQLTDYKTEELKRIFKISDEIEIGKHKNALEGKTVVMFFPSASIRTRVTFEKGIHSLGGQSILFPSEALDKKEKLQDVIGYLNNWVDLLVIRHKDINVLREIAKYSMVPVINAMTDVNHPCEIISDLYAISKIREDFEKDHFLFCGVAGNIGNTWREASEIFNFSLEQCCPEGYEMKGVKAYHGIDEAIIGKDIICTDSIPAEALEKFRDCQVTKSTMDKANPGAILNPCPPFYRGEEVSEDVIDSTYFVGYAFKKSLLPVQQAIILNCLK